MEISIRQADDWNEYRDAWNSLMSHHYWFKQKPLYDFNQEEELEEMKESFSDENFVYFVAQGKENDEILGLVGIDLSHTDAVINRWEPAVQELDNKGAIGNELLEHAFQYSKEKGKLAIRTRLKYPTDTTYAKWHHTLFERNGFFEPQPPMVGQMMKLGNFPIDVPKIDGVTIETSENYSDYDIAELTVRCFTSTPEDLEIHGSDPSVTEYNVSLRVTKFIRSNVSFPSPTECWQIAKVEGEPVALVGSQIRESNIHPSIGVLGPVGVVGEHRRKGIAKMLIRSVLKTLKGLGCEYSSVGTFVTNSPAITLYTSMGYKDSSRLILLRRIL
ncbi:MAG: GNAT family N-acetyltransferase [Candidatus Thorarchaeota archaeon]|jgi:GNAT superfamily N-acetyltransferase